MMWTDNPVLDAERYDAANETKLMTRPVCCECGEHVRDAGYYKFGNAVYCENCVSYHWEWIEE